eukprot:CAMPEP_0175920340 /NCGR_PEP_ID=MMETSP0108-20121206/12876_1 /TAXON_ID=195067 ORGANISM="Goniomonas pacifica, Strain CCMP1869" /NCGR_SAMPLE_ID=MMETSP0108 /ASSEMBLY_ACC=CAM_ASM_000204 /LENGTH=224 /DNA_ID=CAMNT_0017243049 /DNA_START=9 /DNA_END=680 /DNA_ORIENTATION=+
MLTKLVEHEEGETVSPVKDEDGRIFIDRNGRVFEAVLDYLRTGNFSPTVPRTQLVDELDYFGIRQTGAKDLGASEMSFMQNIEDIIDGWQAKVSEFLRKNFEDIEGSCRIAAVSGEVVADIVRDANLPSYFPSDLHQRLGGWRRMVPSPAQLGHSACTCTATANCAALGAVCAAETHALSRRVLCATSVTACVACVGRLHSSKRRGAQFLSQTTLKFSANWSEW